MLVASVRGMPPIVDPNYQTEEACEVVKAEFVTQFPNYETYCMAVGKPDKAPKIKKARSRRKR